MTTHNYPLFTPDPPEQVIAARLIAAEQTARGLRPGALVTDEVARRSLASSLMRAKTISALLKQCLDQTAAMESHRNMEAVL